MENRGTESLMKALGFGDEAARLYERLLPLSDLADGVIAKALGISVAQLGEAVVPLVEAGIVDHADGELHALNPAEAVSAMLSREAQGAADAHARLAEIARALPSLAGIHTRATRTWPRGEQPLDGEVFSSTQVTATLEAVITHSTGDLKWLRPDQWALPSEDLMSSLVRKAIENGRRARAIYPARALSEAPQMLAFRAEIGEEIRVLPELPTRLLVVGTSHALLPDPLGHVDARLLIRQRGIVESLNLLFEELWARGAVPDVGRGYKFVVDVRRMLLQQLAAGAQDEQIARRLGLSLRTVRRRVAELMTALGAESRFQAGVEAARRGWL